MMGSLTELEALECYAQMLNTCDSTEFEKLLADEFCSTSQAVLSDITSKDDFVGYIREKLKTIKSSENRVFAELGRLSAYGHSDCVVLAQGDKINLVATAFITIEEGKVSKLDLCVVPPPQQAKRTGIYPGLVEADGNHMVAPPPLNEFISYATEYDSYRGEKKWSEIPLECRRAIAEYEFLNKECDFEEIVMASSLRKSQAAGVRSLIVSVRMLYEETNFIGRGDLSEDDGKKILAFFKGTNFHLEISKLLDGTASEITNYDGVELEQLAQIGGKASPLDSALDMAPSVAKEFIRSFLTPVKMDASDKVIEQQISMTEEPDSGQLRSKPEFVLNDATSKGIFSTLFKYPFACSEVKWVCEEIEFFFDSYNFMATDVIRKESIRQAKDTNKTKYSIRVDRKKPKEIALLIISNISFNRLASGHGYIYRGVLSIIGRECLKVFNAAVGASEALGFISQQEAKEDMRNLSEQIKKNG